MYFRMLKRDLTDKVGLNITLFVFMILGCGCDHIVLSILWCDIELCKLFVYSGN